MDLKFKTRFDTRSHFDRFKVGKLVPVHAVPVRTQEGGVLSQSLRLELDPIPGRLITPLRAEVHVVYVPVQAIDAIDNPEGDYVGVTEVTRIRAMSGNPLYALENDNEIAKRCNVTPASIGGVKKVCPSIRLAHAAAVNALRRRVYVDAQLVDKTLTAITPALLSSTILQRLDGVLDPDDRINGRIAFQLPERDLRVKGIGRVTAASPNVAAHTVRETGGESVTYPAVYWAGASSPNNVHVRADYDGASYAPAIFAEFKDVATDGLSVADFYKAEMKEKFVRDMRDMIEANPQYGRDMVLRAVHGLMVDTGKTPIVLHHEVVEFGGGIVKAMDALGIEEDTMRSDRVVEIGYSLPVPRTELGGVIMTFVSVKPDEVIPAQPHPVAAAPWVADNFMADELQVDPVPVKFRELDANVASGSEETVAFYTGLNALHRNYQSYGISRRLDPELIDNKMMIYQLQIPLSVSPSNVLYPDDFTQHIFADSAAEVVGAFVNSSFVCRTPKVFGPSPVELVDIVDEEDLFEEEEV